MVSRFINVDRNLRRGFAVTALACVAAGCGVHAPGDGSAQHDTSAIVGGTSASAYPESVIIDLYRGDAQYGYCSGTVIASRVVLTAGHCIEGFDSWRVTAPFAENQAALATRSAVYDWKGNLTRSGLNPSQHDVGLIFLDARIALKVYPIVATAPLNESDRVVNIGRVDNGTVSSDALFVGPKIQVHDATSSGYPFDYTSSDVTQTGDSGGPVVVVTSGGVHRIVAVNSGSNGDIQVLARTDLVAPWIEELAGTRSYFVDSRFVRVRPRW